MAKNVYKPSEVSYQTRRLFIEPPRVDPEKIAEVAAEEAFASPSMEDRRQEADEFRRQFEQERQQQMAEAEAQAENIKKEAERVAFEEMRRKTSQAQKIRQEAQDEADKILAAAKVEGDKTNQEAQEAAARVEQDAYEKGFRSGHEKGYADGESEVKRLVDRLHVILSKAIEKRNEIIESSETQVINLVLLITRKVIKVISENQKNVVINNVIQALRKLKSRGDVVIRVNFADLELTTGHVDDFMKMVEHVKSITVLEDSTVDRGGSIIETDFGQLDARISSQLHEIEERIVELAPIRQDLR